MRTVATLTATAVALSLWAPSARAFERTLRTHGGYWNWRAYRTMRFDVSGWPFTVHPRGWDLQTVDLQSKKIRIDGGTRASPYHVGFDGSRAWVQPSPAAIAAPVRFYATVPFQFIGMPFLLAEPGVIQESLGERELDGRTYDAYEFRFPPGAGAISDDITAYVDPETDLLRLVHFSISYPGLEDGGGLVTAKHAVVFEEWQNVDGLVVPRILTIREWKGGSLGEPKARLTVENADFDRAAADPVAFAGPGF